MNNFTGEFLQRAIEQIERSLKENLFENMESTVMIHSTRFQNETNGNAIDHLYYILLYLLYNTSHYF